MRSWTICVPISLVLFILVTGCKNKNSENIGVPVVKLKKHHPLKLDKNVLLGLPVKLKYDNKADHLFILDVAKQKVIELDDSNKVVNTYGGRGKGPGEALRIDNFFLTPKYLFTVDGAQRLINKYNLQDGHYISSLNYGQLLSKIKKKSKTGAPQLPYTPYMDENNLPFITQNGTILLPTQKGGKYLYETVNWKRKKLADIGAIPAGHAVIENHDKYFSHFERKTFLAPDSAEAFPVDDCLNPGDIYIVYPAVPKIAEYSLSGRKIWEHKIPRTPEVDSLLIKLSNRVKGIMNHRPSNHHSARPIRTYITGRCGPNGDLYLSTFTFPAFTSPKGRRPLWIHQFSPKGKLLKRYKIVSDSNNVMYFPAIDFKKHRIYVTILHNTHIRIYDF
jgi:hypothetical protein